jgi:hypothetical protein
MTGLMLNGYRLHLKRDALGACSAELSRGLWPFKRQVQIDLDRRQFEAAKELLGANPRRRVKHGRNR